MVILANSGGNSCARTSHGSKGPIKASRLCELATLEWNSLCIETKVLKNESSRNVVDGAPKTVLSCGKGVNCKISVPSCGTTCTTVRLQL